MTQQYIESVRGDRLGGHTPFGDVIDALRGVFRRLSDGAKELEGADRDGVAVHYSNTRRGIVLFEFVTHDDCHVQVEVDLRAVDREYIENTLAGVLEYINKHRASRSPVWLPASAGVQ